MSDAKTVEAILFAAGTRVTVPRLCELSGLDEQKVMVILESLKGKYLADDTPYELIQMGAEWKLTVKKAYIPIVEKIAPDTEFSKTIIETLAILAWKSPILQSDLIKIRSNKAYDHIGELKEKGFIVKEKYGRSYVLKLTPKFLSTSILILKKMLTKCLRNIVETMLSSKKRLKSMKQKLH